MILLSLLGGRGKKGELFLIISGKGGVFFSNEGVSGNSGEYEGDGIRGDMTGSGLGAVEKFRKLG